MTTYYVDPDTGSNSNDGLSLGSALADLWPFAGRTPTIALSAGDVVLMRGTTAMTTNSTITFYNLPGTPASPIRFEGYSDETAVIDGSSWMNSGGDSQGVQFAGGSYVEVRNFEIRNFAGNAVRLTHDTTDVTNFTFEQCYVHNYGKSSTWAGNGIICYGRVYDCLFIDVECAYGGDAGESDGFYIGGEKAGDHLGNSGGHTFVRCHTHHNADDGFDFFASDPLNGSTLIYCTAYENGYDTTTGRTGDGNGFKMGGSDYTGGNTLYRCWAWDNTMGGFDNNGADHENFYYNVTSFRNKYNFRMTGDVTKGTYNAAVLRNCISASPTSGNQWNTGFDDQYNSWNLNITPSFISTDPANADFLRLSAGDSAIDAGIVLSYTYEEYGGSAPDLGAFEKGLTGEGQTGYDGTGTGNDGGSSDPVTASFTSAGLKVRDGGVFSSPSDLKVRVGGQWVQATCKVFNNVEWITTYAPVSVARIVDDFESGNLSAYTATAGFTVDTSAPVIQGSNSLKCTTYRSWEEAWSLPGDGLENYPTAGDTFRGRFYLPASTASNRLRVAWGLSGYANSAGYMLCYAERWDALEFRVDDAIAATGSIDYSTIRGGWFEFEIQWGSNGTMTFTTFDSSGNQVSQFSHTDTTYTSGGFGFQFYSHDQSNPAADNVTID
jgi:hypothetical protein